MNDEIRRRVPRFDEDAPTQIMGVDLANGPDSHGVVEIHKAVLSNFEILSLARGWRQAGNFMVAQELGVDEKQIAEADHDTMIHWGHRMHQKRWAAYLVALNLDIERITRQMGEQEIGDALIKKLNGGQ